VKCGQRRKWTRGIFCAIFYWSLKDYAPCRQMWCGECYTSNPNVLFQIKSRVEEEAERENNPLMQERLTLAWGNKHRSEKDFKVARDGDHLLVPFECDLCIFRKLKNRNPLLENQQDLLLMACVRRANLDAFWSRAKSTALTNREKVAFGINMSAAMGLLGPYESDSPLPEEDHCGYEQSGLRNATSLLKARI
jgi:ferredoxin